MSSRLGRYRRSCDRCHDQKLRCRRDDGAAVCERCVRAKSKCTFTAITRAKPPVPAFVHSGYADMVAAPAMMPQTDCGKTCSKRAGRNVDEEYTPTSPPVNAAAAATSRDQEPASFDFLLQLSAASSCPPPGSAEMEWDDFLDPTASAQSTITDDRTLAGATTAYEFSPLTEADLHAKPFAPASSPPRCDPDTETRRRSDSALDDPTTTTTTCSGSDSRLAAERLVPVLSTLSMELHEFALTIPSVGSCVDARGRYTPLDNREVALDRMLKLSQRFIEILNQLHDAVRATSPRHESGGYSRSSLSQPYAGTSTPVSVVIDQPGELLLLSCYTRIVLTYHSFLEHVEECAKVHMRVPDYSRGGGGGGGGGGQKYTLPSLRVGSFTMESTTSMHVSLLVHMIEAMMTRARALMQGVLRVCAAAPPGMGTRQWDDAGARPEQSAAQSALDGFRPQEERTLDLLTQIRRVLFDVAKVQWSNGI
ncbi:Fungal transcriptional regulatory [Cordyceps militaris]|uniref:Fungal transcriptional regulatory n=1 Tax=Cordyceps militaris TaxID=73501 RepID=A0A2H4SHI7_CORMI|nr:Fungal transcriptional regulatory [Cordyceps militaris]